MGLGQDEDIILDDIDHDEEEDDAGRGGKEGLGDEEEERLPSRKRRLKKLSSRTPQKDDGKVGYEGLVDDSADLNIDQKDQEDNDQEEEEEPDEAAKPRPDDPEFVTEEMNEKSGELGMEEPAMEEMNPQDDIERRVSEYSDTFPGRKPKRGQVDMRILIVRIIFEY